MATGYMFDKSFTAAMDAAKQRQAFINNLSDFSFAMSIGGAVSSAIGAYYQLVNQKNQLKSQALSMEFASQTAELNANLAEQQVARIRESAENEIGRSNMEYAQQKGAARASAGGRGVVVDQGSSAEQQRAIDLVKHIDALTITLNAEGQMSDVMMEAANQRASAALSRVSAKNISKTAKSLSPEGAFLATAVGGAGKVASMYYDQFASRNRRFGGIL